MEETDVIAEELRGFGLRAANSSVLQKLIQLGLKWDVDETSLVEKYVAFQRNGDLPDEILQKHVELFDREISSKFESAKHKTIKTAASAPVTTKLLPQKMLEELMATESQNDQHQLFSSYIPNSTVPSLSASPLVLSINKENITNAQLPVSDKLEFICIFPTQSDLQSFKKTNRSPSSEWRIQLLNSCSAPIRYMHQPTLEKAEVLDNWAWDVLKQIISDLPEENFNDSGKSSKSSSQSVSSISATNPSPLRDAFMGASSQPMPKATGSLERTTYLRSTCTRLQTSALVAGRIASQSTLTASSTLNSQTGPEANESELQMHKQRLQLSNAGVIGLRRVEGVNATVEGVTHLEFSQSNTSSYSIYSGQPVLLRATNPTGQLLNVEEIFTPPTMEHPNPVSATFDLNVMIACGPYTFANSNDPSLLFTFLRAVKRNRPHVLILLGPFVDATQPAVQSYCETTYEELFQSRLNSVAEYCSHLDVQLVIVPSWRESHHDPVYPTPPLDREWTNQTAELSAHYRNVHFVWDPSVISIGGYVFGVTSVDVLFDLSSEEISARCTGDRMARLCQHLLSSQTFYPVHPPADDLPLDYALWSQRARLSPMPHCLICPSRLRQFVKDVDGILCINPGHVSRSQVAGSYAVLTIHAEQPDATVNTSPPTRSERVSDSWSITNRTSVFVSRL